MTDKQWRAVFRQLVAWASSKPTAKRMAHIKLTGTARGVLKGAPPFHCAKTPSGRASASRRTATVAPASFSPSGPLLKALRDWRVATARDHWRACVRRVHDATLEAIAVTRPQTLDDFAVFQAIGRRKARTLRHALLSITTAA